MVHRQGCGGLSSLEEVLTWSRCWRCSVKVWNVYWLWRKRTKGSWATVRRGGGEVMGGWRRIVAGGGRWKGGVRPGFGTKVGVS